MKARKNGQRGDAVQFGRSCHHLSGADIDRICRWLAAKLICFGQAGSMLYYTVFLHKWETRIMYSPIPEWDVLAPGLG